MECQDNVSKIEKTNVDVTSCYINKMNGWYKKHTDV